MSYNLLGSSLLSLMRHNRKSILHLLDLSSSLKTAKYSGHETPRLKGKNIVLIFDKLSTRTRCAFEVAAYDQGAHVTYMGPGSFHMGVNETIKDTARVLGRFYDAIEYRGTKQKVVEDLQKYSGVPVFNGLTEDYHPTQMLADLLTMKENAFKPLKDISYAYTGDAQSNMGKSLFLTGAKMGMTVRVASPKKFWPDQETIDLAHRLAEKSEASILLTEDVHAAVKGVDFIHTDVWFSMGYKEWYPEGAERKEWDETINLMRPYQVNKKLMESSGNKDVKFMHCLPAFNNASLPKVQKIAKVHPDMAQGMEVTEEVFESEASLVFDQAENRMHTIKALLLSSLEV